MSQSTLQNPDPGGAPLSTRLPWLAAVLLAVQHWLHALDQILRGERTRPSVLREQSLRIPLAGLSLLILGLALSYGFCMGMYPGCRIDGPSAEQWLACTLKIPALFALTLCVTFPSLYVVNALVGSRLHLLDVLKLLVAALAVNLAVLASIGPIVGFFSFSTTSADFICLLNVLVFAVSGIMGMSFLLQTLHRMSTIPVRGPEVGGQKSEVGGQGPEVGPGEKDAWARPFPPQAIGRPAGDPSALDALEGHVLGRHVKTVFWCWTLIFSVVGAQMAWVLRPYFGNAEPGMPFVWFGPRTSNFFEGVWTALHKLLS